MALIVLVWRENPRRYGMALGDWRLGLPVAIAGIAIMCRSPSGSWGNCPISASTTPCSRRRDRPGASCPGRRRGHVRLGVLLPGLAAGNLRRKYGTDAIWLQMIPFALMHVWKPELEVLSTIAGGVFFGILAWRTDRSSGAGCSTGSWSRGSSWSRPATSEAAQRGAGADETFAVA